MSNRDSEEEWGPDDVVELVDPQELERGLADYVDVEGGDVALCCIRCVRPVGVKGPVLCQDCQAELGCQAE